eukprot:CAMPEP_0172327398 /NCGR_PEP_ID=MMETSP1058-20130122/59472_1 /TAXON_ID=83371 /ORGANISM="Detonula confervacea, Strain CCMP 353" /LENGTH=356 /DNA_ID=CAMNT_0013044435 /DNA_START=376 /DNA_END=1446 /DNA_ORIENTATION=-
MGDPKTITSKHKRHVDPLSTTKKGKHNHDRPFQTIEEDNNSCHPMDPWQVTPRPSCNKIHELGFMTNENPHALKYVASGGWRLAWRLMENDDTKLCLKTIKYDSDLFGQNTLMRHATDAILTEHLTSSPNIINVYAYCAHSTINDFADKSLKNNYRNEDYRIALTVRNKAEHVRDIARGLADLHGAESGEESLSMAVYNDLKPPNLVLMDDRVVLSDFNSGEILLRNVTDGKQCRFQRHHMGHQNYYDSPEELTKAAPLSEKVDIYALGSVIYYIVVGRDPSKKLEGNDLVERVVGGIPPELPKKYSSSEDPIVNTLVKIMNTCHQKDPKERPNARDIVRDLDTLLRHNNGVATVS